MSAPAKIVKPFVVLCSRAAGLCGRHKFKPRGEELIYLWAKRNPDSLRSAAADLGVNILDPRKEILEKDKGQKLENFIGNFNSAERSTAEVADALKNVELVGKAAGLSKDAVDALVGDVRKGQGVVSEKAILDSSEQSLGAKIQARNDQLRFMSLTPHITLCGKIDGQLDGGVLVEAKRRTRRLFAMVPEYERVQVHLYMAMLDVKKALLIESLDRQKLHHNIDFDEEFFQAITNEMEESVGLIQRCVEGDSDAMKTVLVDLQPKSKAITWPL